MAIPHRVGFARALRTWVEDLRPPIVIPGVRPSFKPPELILDRAQEGAEAAPAEEARALPTAGGSLQAELQRERSANAALARENRFIQRMLDDRDRQVAAFQSELAGVRRDWLWRTVGAVRAALARIRRQSWMSPASGAPSSSGRRYRAAPRAQVN
jgi:hypothetical protein